MSRAGNLLHALRADEIRGRRSSSLTALGPGLCARIDDSEQDVRVSLARQGMGSLVMMLEQKLEQRAKRAVAEDPSELSRLVSRVGHRICESMQQRAVFLHRPPAVRALLLDSLETNASTRTAIKRLTTTK